MVHPMPAGPLLTDVGPYKHFGPQKITYHPRARQMAALYRGGATLTEIGNLYGVSRQRVQQLMSRYCGITNKNGGRTVVAQARKDNLRRRKNTKYMAKYGLTYEDLAAIRQKAKAEGQKDPLRAFIAQSSAARYEGIRWSINFRDWWKMWSDSGKWPERGRGLTGFGLCRRDRAKPFCVENCYVGKIPFFGKEQK